MRGKGTKLGEGKGTKLGEGEGTKLGERCQKVRLIQDRMPIEPLTHSHFLPSPSYARGGGKWPFPLPQLSWGRGESVSE